MLAKVSFCLFAFEVTQLIKDLGFVAKVYFPKELLYQKIIFANYSNTFSLFCFHGKIEVHMI